jgi:hypothetical protein
MKTSDLIGPALDWAVAKTIWYEQEGEKYEIPLPAFMAKYSTDWAQGGPIIEREGICINICTEGDWVAETGPASLKDCPQLGPTPLIAAMRCYCCAKLGDDIDIPEELK